MAEKRKDSAQLCSDIFRITTQLYQRYSFLGIPKEEFQTLMKETVKNYMDSKQAKRSKDPAKFFERCLEHELYLKIGNMIRTKQEAVFVMDQFLNTEWMKNKDNTIMRLNAFGQFTENIHYSFDQSFCAYFLKQSEKINRVLRFTFKRLEKDGTIPGLWNNPNILLLLQVYSKLHHIPFKMQIREPRKKADKYDLETTDIKTLYLNEIGRIPLLTKSEERELGFRILKGDPLAVKELIERNLRLVVSVASTFSKLNLSFLDAIQVGNLALMKAAQRFDVTIDGAFSTYATECIKGYILRYIDWNQIDFYTPYYIPQQLNRYRKAYSDWRNQFHTIPTKEVLSKQLNLPMTQIEMLSQLATISMVSLDQPFNLENEDDELGNFIPDKGESLESIVFQSCFKKEINQVLQKCLTPQEARMAQLFDRRDVEIGRFLGISRAYVGQLRKNVIMKLQQSPLIDQFADYMDNPDYALQTLKNFRLNKGEMKKTGSENKAWLKEFGNLIAFCQLNQNVELVPIIETLVSDFQTLLMDCGLTLTQINRIQLRYFVLGKPMTYEQMGKLCGCAKLTLNSMMHRAQQPLMQLENDKKITQYMQEHSEEIKKLQDYRDLYPKCAQTQAEKVFLKK